MLAVSSQIKTMNLLVVYTGVGISVVNALSERVDIQVKRNGEVYKIAFEMA